MAAVSISRLDSSLEGSFLDYLKADVISNYFALLDLKFHKGRTQFWIAQGDTKILGYLLEFDGKILHLRGSNTCAAELLKQATLTEPNVFIEPEHLPIVEKFYEPTRPLGSLSLDKKITTLLAMEVNRGHFKRVIGHDPQRLNRSEFDAVEGLHLEFCKETGVGPITRERITRVLSTAITYGIYEGDEIVSFANGRTVENISHVAPVYTSPQFRGKGYATSVCSALVDELLDRSERVILFVREDDAATLKLYEKIGFTKAGYKFLTFWGRRIMQVR